MPLAVEPEALLATPLVKTDPEVTTAVAPVATVVLPVLNPVVIPPLVLVIPVAIPEVILPLVTPLVVAPDVTLLLVSPPVVILPEVSPAEVIRGALVIGFVVNEIPLVIGAVGNLIFYKFAF